MKRRTEIDRPYSIGNGLIGDGAGPDESASPQTYIAKILLGDQVSDIVTSPNKSVTYAALSNSIAVISRSHEVSRIIPVSGRPRVLTIDADGGCLYANNYGDTASVIDIADHRVHVIPGACYVQQVDTVDGAFTYAAGNTTNSGGCDGWISVIDARGATVDAVAGLDGYAITDLAADPEGKRVYVGLSRQSAHYQYDTGLVGVIDTTTKVITMEQKMIQGIRDRACQTRRRQVTESIAPHVSEQRTAVISGPVS